MIAIPWLVLDRTGSAAAAGLLGALVSLPGIVVSPFVGALIDRVGRRPEVDAAFDDARGGRVLGRGDDTAGANREDTARAEARGAVGREGADDRRATEVVELQARQGVVAEEGEGAGAVDDDRVARSDCAGSERGDVTATDAHARGRVGGQRDEARRGDVERALVDDRAAREGILTEDCEVACARLDQRTGTGDEGSRGDGDVTIRVDLNGAVAS